MNIDSYMGRLRESDYPYREIYGSWCKLHEVAELQLRMKMLLNIVKDSLEVHQDNLAGKFDHAANYTYYVRMKHAIQECEAP